MRVFTFVIGAVVVAGVAGTVAYLNIGETATLDEMASTGPSPVLPDPVTPMVPTVKIAPATGWPDGQMPAVAEGLTITAFATGLDHPRTLLALPNGDVLVAETNAPPRPDDGKGIKGWVMKRVMARAGAAVPSANRITLLRDADGDGVAEISQPFLTGLNSPFGMALVGDQLYVANTDAVVRFPYVAGATEITDPGTVIAALPAGSLNHHWTKGLAATEDGSRLYASVGSNSNVAENGMEAEEGRAAIHEITVATGEIRLFAGGLRNPVDVAVHPDTGVLWTVVNERDELGSDLVPDYLTSVQDGGFYGWPYSYWGQTVDTRVTPPNPELVAKAIAPDYALGNHVAPLGLAFTRGTGLPAPFQGGVFVGEHGSWNRNPRSGYKVVHVALADGKPTGAPVDVATGFVDVDGNALGRPVDVETDATGALLVADDVGNVVWRITGAVPQSN